MGNENEVMEIFDGGRRGALRSEGHGRLGRPFTGDLERVDIMCGCVWDGALGRIKNLLTGVRTSNRSRTRRRPMKINLFANLLIQVIFTSSGKDTTQFNDLQRTRMSPTFTIRVLETTTTASCTP